MMPSLPIRRLYWKEARQLLPLLMLLGALAFVFHSFDLFDSHSTSRSLKSFGFHYALLFSVPVLFAVGAGAIVVGQEKEQRTITWLSSLPIKPQDLIRVKLVSCLLGLLAAWIISIVLLLVFGFLNSNRLQTPSSLQGEPATFFLSWPLHSLSLLLAGIALAWYSRSSLTGLLFLIPVAVLPGFLVDLIDHFARTSLHWGILPAATKFVLLSTIHIAICLSAYWLSWRFALRALSAQVVPSGKRDWLRVFGYKSLAAETEAFQPSVFQPKAILRPASALVWQSIRQNRKFLLWTAFFIIAAFVFVVRSASGIVNNEGIVGLVWQPFLLSSFFGACWIGVLTFQSDRMQRRIGFLAHRGVSVTLTWWTRQIVPISVLCLVIVVCYSLMNWNHDLRELKKYSLLFTLISLVALLLASYSVSQWVGQIFTHPIVAAVTSPLIAFTTFYYFFFAWRTLSAPIWLLALCFVIPLLATWTTMRRWMDSRLDKVFWMTHSVCLLAFLFMPWIPLTATLLTLPSGMSREIADELAVEAAKYKSYDFSVANKHLYIVIPRPPGLGVKLEPNETLASLRQYVMSHLQQIVRSHDGPLLIEQDVVDFLIKEAMLFRDNLSNRSTIKDVGTAVETEVEMNAETSDASQYRAFLKLSSDIVVRTRLCHQIRQQDRCDTIEIWLLSELQLAKGNPIAMKLIGDELYATITERLANWKARNDARRRSLALSWKEWLMPVVYAPNQRQVNYRKPIGQYYLRERSFDNDLSWLSNVIYKRNVSSLATHLWLLAKAGSTNGISNNSEDSPVEIFKRHWTRIASLVEVPVQFYGIGPRGEFLRADNPQRFVFETTNSQRRAPASQWFADWERQAAALVSKESP